MSYHSARRQGRLLYFENMLKELFKNKNEIKVLGISKAVNFLEDCWRNFIIRALKTKEGDD